MDYKMIFQDRKYSPNRTKNQEDFAMIRVYAPPEHGLPCLVEFVHGNQKQEGWQKDWELLIARDNASAIRKAIEKLDSYVLLDNMEGG